MRTSTKSICPWVRGRGGRVVVGEGAGVTVGEGAVGRGCLSGFVARGRNRRKLPDGSGTGATPACPLPGVGKGRDKDWPGRAVRRFGGCCLLPPRDGVSWAIRPGVCSPTPGLFLLKGLRTRLGLQLTKASSCENSSSGVTALKCAGHRRFPTGDPLGTPGDQDTVPERPLGGVVKREPYYCVLIRCFTEACSLARFQS